MKIKWVGHACFLISSADGTKIITDPYATSENLKYREITKLVKEPVDIVTISHDHSDHNNVAAIQGNLEVVKETATVKGINFKGIPTYHDDSNGEQRGKNTIFCFEVDGIVVCHLGDLGHPLNAKQVTELGSVDVLLIPVGGNYTIDAKVATLLYNKLTPKVVIPMHYKTDKLNYPIAGVDEFLREKKNVKRLGTEAQFKQGDLPTTTQIIVLESTTCVWCCDRVQYVQAIQNRSSKLKVNNASPYQVPILPMRPRSTR